MTDTVRGRVYAVRDSRSAVVTMDRVFGPQSRMDAFIGISEHLSPGDQVIIARIEHSTDLTIVARVKQLVAPDDIWKTLAANTGYGAHSSDPTLSYTIHNGLVLVRGRLAKASGNIAVGDVLATMPVGYRPLFDVATGIGSEHPFMTMQGNGWLTIKNDGTINVTAVPASATYCSLGGITYVAGG